jgi:protein ImuB
LPRAALARRFHSPEISEAVLLRLDQALGRRDEPISPLLPVPSYRSRAAFAEPIVDGAFVPVALRDLLADLCRILAEDTKGARRLTLMAARVDGTTSTVGVGTSAPSRDTRHLAHLFEEKLAGLDPGFGIDALILSADVVDPLEAEQTGLHDGAGSTPCLTELVDRLANTLGADNVAQSCFRQSHIPERAETFAPAGAAPPVWPDRMEKPPRPFRLFTRPEPIEVTAEVPEGPPLLFVWRRLPRRVVRAEGPERILPEWWLDLPSADGLPRDYYRVEDVEGHRYWVFREGLYDRPGNGTPRWYVHGLFG